MAEFVDKEVVPVAAKIDEEGQFLLLAIVSPWSMTCNATSVTPGFCYWGGGTSEILRPIISRQMGL